MKHEGRAQRGCRKTNRYPEANILRFFSACGDLRALLPILAELPDEIERTRDKNGIRGCGMQESVVEGVFSAWYDDGTRRVVRGNFGELCRRDGSLSARFRKNYFCCARKEEARDFVDSFVPESPVEKADFAPSKIFFQKRR